MQDQMEYFEAFLDSDEYVDWKIYNFIDERLDLNHKTKTGRNLLYKAFRANDFEMVKELLKEGAILDNSFLYISHNCRPHQVDYALSMLRRDFRDPESGRGVYHDALYSHNSSMSDHLRDQLKRLVELGFNVNTRDRDGNTALHAFFESNGCDLHIKNPETMREMVQLFIGAGATGDALNYAGRIPATEAVDSRLDETAVECLLDGGTPIDAPDYWGNTMLSSALVWRNWKVAEWLIARGANVNAERVFGAAPLRTLVFDSKSYVEGGAWHAESTTRKERLDSMCRMIDLLIKHGANLQAWTLQESPFAIGANCNLAGGGSSLNPKFLEQDPEKILCRVGEYIQRDPKKVIHREVKSYLKRFG